jgi:uncharacterized protein YcbK (DUF882 family)
MNKEDWIYKRFLSQEFDCHCPRCKGLNTGLNMDKDFMDFLQMARNYSGVPYRISKGCGFRCKDHNAEIKGSSPSSEHCKGLAVDIPYYNKKECQRIVYGLEMAGFKRIQVYKYKGKHSGWVHTDKSKLKSKPKEWFSIQEKEI